MPIMLSMVLILIPTRLQITDKHCKQRFHFFRLNYLNFTRNRIYQTKVVLHNNLIYEFSCILESRKPNGKAVCASLILTLTLTPTPPNSPKKTHIHIHFTFNKTTYFKMLLYVEFSNKRQLSAFFFLLFFFFFLSSTNRLWVFTHIM